MTLPRFISVAVVVAPFTFALAARAVPQADPLPPLPATSASAPPAPVASSAAPSPVPTTVVEPAPAKPVVAPAPEPIHPAEEPVETKPAPKTDHDKVVGRFGLGYFGQVDVPLGFTGARRDAPSEAAQMIGLRYWWPRVRLDVSFGWNMGAGSQTVAGTKSDGVSTLVLVGRVALPFALLSDDHYTFFLGPEIAYGHAGETVPAAAPTVPGAGQLPDTSHDGSRFSIGGRAGAEIQFGFIGIPRLALDATISLSLDLLSGSTTGPDRNAAPLPGQPQPTSESSFSRTAVRSSTQHQPWNIFVSNVAAVYYF